MENKKLLPNARRVVFLNAGHHTEDPGAISGKFIERDEVKKIRDACLPLFEAAGFVVMVVPDNLNLRESIAWVNRHAKSPNDGLALDIHLNAFHSSRARGTEVFHGASEADVMRRSAEIISQEVSKSLGIPNRGAKADTQSFLGSLGWIRKTNCWALLVEVCFITSPEDMAIFAGRGGYEKAAQGIVRGCEHIFGTAEPDEIEEEEMDEGVARLKKLLDKLLRVLRELLAKLKR